MTPNPECLGTQDTIQRGAERMVELKIGAMPICGPDRRIKGVLTDRDIAVRGLATGKDTTRTVGGDLNQGAAVTVGADDMVEVALTTMISARVRRVPVVDGDQLVGMITVSDVARAMPDPQVGQLTDALALEL